VLDPEAATATFQHLAMKLIALLQKPSATVSPALPAALKALGTLGQVAPAVFAEHASSMADFVLDELLEASVSSLSPSKVKHLKAPVEGKTGASPHQGIVLKMLGLKVQAEVLLLLCPSAYLAGLHNLLWTMPSLLSVQALQATPSFQKDIVCNNLLDSSLSRHSGSASDLWCVFRTCLAGKHNTLCNISLQSCSVICASRCQKAFVSRLTQAKVPQLLTSSLLAEQHFMFLERRETPRQSSPWAHVLSHHKYPEPASHNIAAVT